MTMMHLKYPATRGFYSWDELGCLSRALGFQADVFKWKIAEVGIAVEGITGMSTKELTKLIDLKYFDIVVDKTLNGHTADWNLCVLRKALMLIEHSVLTFEDLHQIRAAYQAYEAQDLKGLELNEKTLLRCLKMCGRVIAPLKMQHRIKHMSQTFDEEGRIQLYEFLDLILWCEIYDNFKRPKAGGYQKKKLDNNELFEIPDFHKLIAHHDERLSKYLNERYLKEEWDFGKETYTKHRLPKEPPVNRDFRLEQIRDDKSKYRHLKTEVTKSQKHVYNAQAGYVRPRPISAPGIDEYEKSDKSSIHTAQSQRPPTVYELVKDFLAPQSAVTLSSKKHRRRDSSIREETMVQELTHPQVTPAVTQSDVDATAASIQDLKFQMTTLELKYRQSLLEDMSYFVPGRHLPESTEHPPTPVENSPPVPAGTAREGQRGTSSADALAAVDRLAYSPYRPPPTPSHGATCDARFRGWHTINIKHGKHYVLTTTAYDNSPSGSMLMKLHKKAHAEVQNIKGDYATRYTRRGEVRRPDTMRPATAPSAVSTGDVFATDGKGRNKNAALRQTRSSNSTRLSVSSSRKSDRSEIHARTGYSTGFDVISTNSVVTSSAPLRSSCTSMRSPLVDDAQRGGESSFDEKLSGKLDWGATIRKADTESVETQGVAASISASVNQPVTRVSFINDKAGDLENSHHEKRKSPRTVSIEVSDVDAEFSSYDWQDFNIYKDDESSTPQQKGSVRAVPMRPDPSMHRDTSKNDKVTGAKLPVTSDYVAAARVAARARLTISKDVDRKTIGYEKLGLRTLRGRVTVIA